MSKNHLELCNVLIREDAFESRYFDRQIAFRYLFRLFDEHTIESGAYQHFFGNVPTTLAIDISSMIGCPQQCKFCASASIPYFRVLTVDEMLAQAEHLIAAHDTHAFPKITCSFQGIGEPSLIADRLVQVSKQLMSLDQRIAVSISTTAVRLDAFRTWRDGDVMFDNLQISHSATTDEQIDWLMPGLPEFREIFQEATLCLQSPNFKKVKFNYTAIQGFNDSVDDVSRLVSRFRGTDFIVKISMLNPTEAATRYDLAPATYNRVREISNQLQASGVQSYAYGICKPTSVSCGQLTFLRE